MFIMLAVCGDGLVMDANDACVCAVDYYQTADGTPPTCAQCPPGSTTNGETNSDACGKYD